MLYKKLRYNQIQLEKTAELFLEITKTVILATIIGLLVPGVGEKVGLGGAVIGGFLSVICYLLAMIFLREVKR